LGGQFCAAGNNSGSSEQFSSEFLKDVFASFFQLWQKRKAPVGAQTDGFDFILPVKIKVKTVGFRPRTATDFLSQASHKKSAKKALFYGSSIGLRCWRWRQTASL